MRDISTLELANSMIHSVLVQEQKKIEKELLDECNLRSKDVVCHQGQNHRYNNYLQQKRSINDYRNYVWLSVNVNGNTYWITLFYNDVDKNSGNFHTQFGRIQFWKNVQPHGKGNLSPHVKMDLKKSLYHGSKERGVKRWCFC